MSMHEYVKLHLNNQKALNEKSLEQKEKRI